MSLACLDGRVLPAAAARLPVTDEGLLRGDVGALLAAEPGFEGAVRMLVTRGGHRVALLEAIRPQPPAVALAPVTFAPSRLMDGIKSLSYGANMLATRLAQEEGADDALLVTPHGRVLEAPTRSLLYALPGDDALHTPPLADHILDSITRRHLIAAVAVVEQVTTLDDLAAAEEAFLASTTHEVLPVRAVGERALPLVPGPRTRAAAAALRARIDAALAAASPA